jgi:hypothetical protein
LDKSLPIITTSHATEELSLRGFTNPQNLETWESISFVKGDIQLNITAAPGRHGPIPVSIFLPQVMGSILDFQTKDDQWTFMPIRHTLSIYIHYSLLLYLHLDSMGNHVHWFIWFQAHFTIRSIAVRTKNVATVQ